MSNKEVHYLRRFMAVICHYCPVCRFGRQTPGSILGRILHHPFHADHCPFWKAEKAVYDKG